MCINCWKESGVTPVINDKTKKAVELIQAVYDCVEGGAGGYGHIVFDDWNIDDSSIDFCLNEIKKDVTIHEDEWDQQDTDELKRCCTEALTYFKTLTEDEKYTAVAIQGGDIDSVTGQIKVQ